MTAPARSRLFTTIRNNVFVVEITTVTAGGQSFAYTVRRKDAHEIIHSGRVATIDVVLEIVGELLAQSEKK